MSDKHSAALLYALAQTLLTYDPELKRKLCDLILKHLRDTGAHDVADEIEVRS